ncbi:hypothetical protein JHV666_03090 [Mycobacterium avium subsp. hominissuis]
MDPTPPGSSLLSAGSRGSHSPTRNVLILPKDSAWFRLAAQILETRSRADGLAPARPAFHFVTVTY